MQEFIPKWLSEHQVAEERFDRAYSDIDGQKRSWLKKCLAQLYTWYSPNPVLQKNIQSSWRQGFYSVQFKNTSDWIFLCLQAGLNSPVQALAALIPPLLSGSRVMVLGQEFPDPVLLAMELAGMEEHVYEIPVNARQKLMADWTLPGSSRVMIVSLEHNSEAQWTWLKTDRTGSIRFLTLQSPKEAGLWLESDEKWNIEGLAFAHPDLEIKVWGSKLSNMPDNWQQTEGSREEFLKQNYAVSFVPADMVQSALHTSSLVFGPGQECAWIWPFMSIELCLFSGIAWTNGL